MHKAGKLDIFIQKGVPFRLKVTWTAPLVEGAEPTPRDLTGWNAEASVKNVDELEFTSIGAGANILLNSDGEIELFMPAEDLEPIETGTSRWGLKVIPPGDAEPFILLAGNAVVFEDPAS